MSTKKKVNYSQKALNDYLFFYIFYERIKQFKRILTKQDKMLFD